jgi:Ner family transcriptional regulator
MPNAHAWDKHEIKAEIGRRGGTLKSVAEKYGLEPNLVRMTLNRKKPITSADQAISKFLKVPLHELWPDRYDNRGNRLVPIKPLKTPVEKKRRSI